MVESQIMGRGLTDPGLVEALLEVPREEFVPARYQAYAYDDRPLPIAQGQTISQPYIVALMIEKLNLEPHHRVLEVGCGSGYAAAVMSRMANRVFSIERHGELAVNARERLARLGYLNVIVRHGDGTRGWPQEAPFDAISVAAGGATVPPALKHQLKPGGRLVIPVGGKEEQDLLVIVRTGATSFKQAVAANVRFVPLVAGRP